MGMRMKIPFNNDWEFTYSIENGFADSQIIRIPHTVKEIPFNYADESTYQTVCGYRKTFLYTKDMDNKRMFLCFAGAAHLAYVFLNDHLICTHSCGYTAFEAELTEFIKDGENEIIVKLDTRETNNIPPFGHVIDYMTYGGIYREVTLEIRENNYITDVFVRTFEDVVNCSLFFDCNLSDAKITAEIYDENKQLVGSKIELIGSRSGDFLIKEVSFSLTVEEPKLWSITSPTLYTAIFSYGSEKREVRFGFRNVIFKKDGFYLNGEKIKLRGLNRHQSYPYVGYAMPASIQRRDADILKYELGLNAVRTSHYPQSKHFIDRCDEIGLLVFTEIPGWQYIGNEEWQDIAIENCREMITQYRNHPSIVLWGVRINESVDHNDLYKRTNILAHILDPTRQTSGVRYLQKSSLLEDVYAYNDFSYYGGNKKALRSKFAVTPDRNKPYLISEYNGHMFPTKTFDDEEKRLEHALRHAKVLQAMYSRKEICGSFGWCMADYNTHKNFGSGDRICYHGVLDMFRNRKMAAYVYASQSDDQPILHISSSMDIGEHSASNLKNIYAFTNADSVRLYKNENYVGEFYPDKKNRMPHPPILIDDLIGELFVTSENYPPKIADMIRDCLNAYARYGPKHMPFKIILKLLILMMFHVFTFEKGRELFSKYVGNWGGEACQYRFEGIKDGKLVSTVIKAPVSHTYLRAEVESTNLVEKETYDVKEIRITAQDEYGNQLPYANYPLSFSVKGSISIIGPSISSLQGGSGGVYIRSETEGMGILTISSPSLDSVTLSFLVTKL